MLVGSAGAGAAGGIGFLLLIVIAAAAFFAPSIVALARHHHQVGTIIVINLLLGWTFIGWVVALAMSVGAVNKPPPSGY